MNKETENTSKISDSTCKVAPETNAISADAPEQAPKPTLKQAVCSIIEILEQMKKQMTPDGKDYLALEINNFSGGNINISLYSGKASWHWRSPEFKSFEEVEAFDFSENEIAGLLKAKIKTALQELKKEIAKRERKLADLIKYKKSEIGVLKAKLAEIEEKEAGNEE